MHGTGGTGGQFAGRGFAGELFLPGQPLDVAKYFIVMPDDIGHGLSSKPSDGLRAKFPRYGYQDMLTAEHALLTQGLLWMRWNVETRLFDVFLDGRFVGSHKGRIGADSMGRKAMKAGPSGGVRAIATGSPRPSKRSDASYPAAHPSSRRPPEQE